MLFPDVLIGLFEYIYPVAGELAFCGIHIHCVIEDQLKRKLLYFSVCKNNFVMNIISSDTFPFINLGDGYVGIFKSVKFCQS